MGSLHIVRHADAGHAPDEMRSLTDRGRAQADRIVDHLDGIPISRVLSSRYRRCVETVTPLATRRGIRIETHDLRARRLVGSGL